MYIYIYIDVRRKLDKFWDTQQWTMIEFPYLYIFSKYSPAHSILRCILWKQPCHLYSDIQLAPHCRQQQHLVGWEICVCTCDSSHLGTIKSRMGPDRDVGWMSHLISPARRLFQKRNCCIGCVGRGIVMVEQNSSQSCPWPLLLNFWEHLGETNFCIPFRCNCPLIL